MSRPYPVLIAIVCAASLGLAADREAAPPAKPKHLVKLELRDDTTVFGALLSFARGYFVLGTPKGELTVPADRVRRVAPAKQLPPKPKRWRPDAPATEKDEQRLREMLAERKARFLDTFDRPKMPPFYGIIFRDIAAIAYAGETLGQPDLPLELIAEVSRTHKPLTGAPRCVLIACEAVAYTVRGETDKANTAIARLERRGLGLRVRIQLRRFLDTMERRRQR